MTILAIWCLCASGLAQTPPLEKQAVLRMQRMVASELDQALPRLPFMAWFEEVVGPQAGISWQMTECGERDEKATDAAADLPACVEIDAILPDKRKVVVMIAVGTFKKGVIGRPGFAYAIIEQEGQLYGVRRLRDLPQALRVTLLPEEELQNKPVFLVTNPKPPQPEAGRWMGPGVYGANEEPPPPPSPKPALRLEAPRVSESPVIGKAITKVKPVYPPEAKRSNVEGEVEVLVVISETGLVIEAKAVKGNPLLRRAAVDAARKWVFSPTRLNGVAVRAEQTLTFVFTSR
jgi:TonB family protein